MKNTVIKQAEYNSIFFAAITYNEIELIEKYFEGKYNEVKNCNPYELYKDGLNKAFEYHENKIENSFVDRSNKREIPGGINSITLPCFNESSDILGCYKLSDIERIQTGLQMFFKAHENIDVKTSAKASTGTPAPKQVLTSFESPMTNEQLTILHTALLEKNFIAECDSKEFAAIFRAEAIETIKQVRWIAEPVLLAYFINALKDLKLIRRHKKIWVVAGIVFSNESNLRQLKDGYINSKSGIPKFSDAIDQILLLL